MASWCATCTGSWWSQSMKAAWPMRTWSGCWTGCPNCGIICTPSWRSTAPLTFSSVWSPQDMRWLLKCYCVPVNWPRMWNQSKGILPTRQSCIILLLLLYILLIFVVFYTSLLLHISFISPPLCLLGPCFFLSCPVTVDEFRSWFIDLWNYSIIPYLQEGAKDGIKVRNSENHRVFFFKFHSI